MDGQMQAMQNLSKQVPQNQEEALPFPQNLGEAIQLAKRHKGVSRVDVHLDYSRSWPRFPRRYHVRHPDCSLALLGACALHLLLPVSSDH